MNTNNNFYIGNFTEYCDYVSKYFNALNVVVNTRKQDTCKNPNKTASSKVKEILHELLKLIITNNINQVIIPLSNLKKVLGNTIDSQHAASDMRDYFKGYGLGDFNNTRNYTILKTKSPEGELTSSNIKAEAHYAFYINEETLKLLYANGVITEEQCTKFINDIPESKEILQQFSQKSDVIVIIENYISDDYFIETKKEIHRDYNTMEGTYTETITENRNGNETHIDTKSNTFTPKPKDTNKKDNNITNIKRDKSNSITLKSNIGEDIMINNNENQPKLDKNDNFFVKNDEKLEKNDENYIKNDKNKEEDKQYTIKTSLFNNPNNSRSGIRKRNTKNIDSKLSGNR